MYIVNSQNEWPASSIRRDRFQQLYNCSKFREEVNPEINLYIYDQLTFDKRARNIQWGKDSLFNKLDDHMQENKTGPISKHALDPAEDFKPWL